SSYGLAFTDPDFKFPQLWRNNIGIDQRLPFGFIGTAEFIYDRDVNGVYYINANLKEPNTSFTGADARPRWTTGNRVNNNITSAVVLKNQNEGRAWNIAGSLEKPFSSGLFVKGAYSYGESKNTVDPGSIAFGSYNNNQHSGDPNNPGLGFSGNSAKHRLFGAASYRAEWFRFGATTVSMFAEARTIGNTSYTFSGDLNGDGGFSNDLIYIPRDQSEMNFQTFTQAATTTTPAKTFTSQQQAEAWNSFIERDEYLSANRGSYAERGAVFLPLVKRVDVSLAQELFTDIGGSRNGIQLRADVVNFGNLLNKNWGLGQRLITTQPLIVPSSTQGGPADAQGRAQYRLRVINNELVTTPLEQTAGLGDVFQVRLGLRYTFN
ncbi:MAG: TonB-dependent receptor, partial [Gemmatimonadaceae bacterium]|nr:TonB-dependent receptor [Gemmatimonadaceae bacterium]